MNKIEFEEYVKLSSIPLRKIDKNSMPIGLASGCFIDYHEHRLLLTVQHATGDMGDWAAEIKFEPSKGTQMYRLGGINFLKNININSFASRDIDFAYVAIERNTVSYFQTIEPNGNVISEEPRKICVVDFDLEPEKNGQYGFSGQVMPNLNGSHLITEHKVYLDLKYIGKDDDYLIFELPTPHLGHEHFKGCSGSPIVDMKGNTLALVCHGDIDTNRIYGISLKKYQGGV